MELDWPPQFDPAVKAKAVEVARNFITCAVKPLPLGMGSGVRAAARIGC